MSRKVKHAVLRILAVMMLAVAIPFQSFAANAKIAFTDPSTEVGSEFTVTMKFTSTSGDVLGDTRVYLTYDSSMIEYVQGSSAQASGGEGTLIVSSTMDGKTEVSTPLKFKALKEGVATIKVVTDNSEAYDSDGQMLTMDKIGSSKVTIGPATSTAVQSDDASLKSLQISPGTLDPAFSPDVENYTASVGLDIDKLTVSAQPANDNAVVSVEGGDELKDGENTVVCKITAEDGTTVRSYTITVTREKGGQSEPNATTVPAEELDVLAELESSRNAIKIGITDLPAGMKAPAGLKESNVTIGDTKVKGWIPQTDGNPEYCVFYAVNSDTNEQGFYRYDLSEKTIQRYFEGNDSSAIEKDPRYQGIVEELNKIKREFNIARYFAIGTGAGCVVLLIMLFGAYASVSRYRSSKKNGKKKSNSGNANSGRSQSGQTPKRAEKAPERRENKTINYVIDDRRDRDYEDDLPEPMDQDDQDPDDNNDYLPEEDLSVKSEPVEDVERSLKAQLAREAEKATREALRESAPTEAPLKTEDEDDFELFDLEDDNKR